MPCEIRIKISLEPRTPRLLPQAVSPYHASRQSQAPLEMESFPASPRIAGTGWPPGKCVSKLLPSYSQHVSYHRSRITSEFDSRDGGGRSDVVRAETVACVEPRYKLNQKNSPNDRRYTPGHERICIYLKMHIIKLAS